MSINPTFQHEVVSPHRLPKSKILKEDELRRAVVLAAKKVAGDGCIVIVFDSDGDCPIELAERVGTWAKSQCGHCQIRVVLAHQEFETWFLASANSLRGKRRLRTDFVTPTDCESHRDPKGWIKANSEDGIYSETTDQPALAQLFEMDAALANSRSFRKFYRDIVSLVPNVP